jgi:zinc transport system substrate-binding protein
MEPPLRNLVVLLALCSASLAAAEPLPVFVSVLPIKTFVEKVGGEHVVVQAMVRPGHNPHTYDPTPQQIEALARAALYIRIGVPFEDAWMPRIRAANPDMRVLDARNGMAAGGVPHQEHADEQHPARHGDGDHAHWAAGGLDPHVWTSPPRVRKMAGAIRDTLAEIDPAHSQDFVRDFAAFDRELDGLDREIRALLAPVRNRSFLVFHPAWGHFAATYGLTQVAIEREGKEPGARALATLIDQARNTGARVIFVQPQLDRRLATQVARAIDGRLITVDPLAADYVDNLRQVARQFAEVMQP